MAQFPRVSPGDPITHSARLHNATIDVIEWAKDRRTTGAPPVGGRPGSSGIVLVQNNSGADVDRFGVLGISGVIITPTDNEEEFKSNWAVTGSTPAEGDPFVVLSEPIAASKIGRAWISGAVIVKVNVTDADHDHADSAASTASLESAESGPVRILWKESGTGTKWAIVLIGGGGAGGSLPPGGLIYQVLQKFSGNDGDAGWDYVRAHG